MDDVSFDEDETDLVAIMEKCHAQNIAIIQTAHDRHLAELNTLKAQHFTHIQALELKIFTLEQDLVRSKAKEDVAWQAPRTYTHTDSEFSSERWKK